MKTLALVLCAIWILTWDIGEQTNVEYKAINPYTGKEEMKSLPYQDRGKRCFETGKKASDFIREAPKGVGNWKLKKCKVSRDIYCMDGDTYAWDGNILGRVYLRCEGEK